MKQQSVGRHVVTHGHIILITAQHAFACAPFNIVCLANTNLILFDLKRFVLELMIYLT